MFELSLEIIFIILLAFGLYMVFHDNIVLRKKLEIITIEKNKLESYKKDTIKVLAEMSSNLTNMKNNMDSTPTTNVTEYVENQARNPIVTTPTPRPRTVSISNIPPIGQIRRIERTRENLPTVLESTHPEHDHIDNPRESLHDFGEKEQVKV
jgi:hypothetical protein